ncbi:Cytochrome c biogenesis protein CcdA [Rhodoferax sp. OV413]|uniref:cytochrome c biogenesis protein DipZ n=1 Tax=Rhodoferax sp. OV413 TaxID=1855285 RepID=UPI000890B63E|nr:cytochrome c biogenesis protein DipZ [Rhodoferax sp. OV413]SDO70060.1 Cytochrome c biogenesis protein CcdA [Rhodoferax sp. OV413]
MTLYLLAFAAGMLTLLSPCILPVLPFVFARQGRPFTQGPLPLLAGMALAFAAVASLGAVAGAWAAQLNQVGRGFALLCLALFAASLMLPGLARWWSRPLVNAGERLARLETRSPWLGSALLGVATGLIWSPCAGPVLGLVLSSAALLGPSAHTSLLLLSYAAGAAVALWAALRLSANTLATLKARWLPGVAGRRVVGAAMLAGVVAVATGLDTRLLGAFSGAGGAGLEASLLQRVMPAANAAELPDGNAARPDNGAPRPSKLPVESTRASLDGGTQWLNAAPQSIPALRGKVVLVNFWTYSCVNCLRTLPYVKAWAQKYADRGLVVVGVHAPEFAFEKDPGNVKKALKDLQISYPVVQDNDFRIWRAFGNQYWPALYFVDAQGRVRHHQFGEGGYAASERVIEDLLREAGAATANTAQAAVQADTQGLGLAADTDTLRSPETYLGYEKGGGLRVNGSAMPEKATSYTPAALQANTWSLAGNWTLKPEYVEANQAGNRLALRFQARDANLVLGAVSGQPLRFRLTLDGQPPGINHGTDVDAEGNGRLDATRLYQLVRQSGAVKPRTLEIQFLDPGARGYAFTFG